MNYIAGEIQMSDGRSKARGQHYVPRMLQESFTTPGKGKKFHLNVFDKLEEKMFRTSPDNILHERDFNTFNDDNMVFCLENYLSVIENKSSAVLRKIREKRNLTTLTIEEKSIISIFTALQRIRGVSTRAQMMDITHHISERVRSQGSDPQMIPQLRGHDDPEQVKLSALMLIKNNLAEFSKSISNKTMILMEPPKGKTFLLGDSPVTLANNLNDDKFRGTLGLEVKGIEIYLPIAPDLTISFWCPTVVQYIADASCKIDSALRNTAAISLLGVGPDAEEIRRNTSKIRDTKKLLEADLKAIRNGTPVQFQHENMDYVNSLQIADAERYVISASGDFSLVKKMLSNNIEFKKGRRFRVI